MKRLILFVAFNFVLISTLRAELKLPGVISDHMVLQQEQSDIIWGWDTPGTSIVVTFAGKSYSTTTDTDGKWSVKLAPLPANSTPQTLTIAGSSKRELQDILIGEVWLCAGQSNMEMGVGGAQNATNEVAAANYPGIRLLKVPKIWLPEPQPDQGGTWKACTPENIIQGGWNGFCAVGYFFGRELHRKLNVPIGLIDASWGGTRIEPWTPPEGFAAVPELSRLNTALQLRDPRSAAHKERLEQFLGETESWVASTRAALRTNGIAPTMPPYPSEIMPPRINQDPTVIYNGMIYPIHPFTMRGAIWYQGEDNSAGGDGGQLYARKMEALVGAWRQIWGEGEFPFYFVQLAPFAYTGNPDRPSQFYGSPEQLSEFWEGQSIAARQIPNAGMVVINDIGNLQDIHPKNKQEVGRRLALVALAKTYSHNEVAYSGPTFESMAIEGDTLRIRFDHAEGGLVSRDGHALNWFEIIDANKGGFVKAQARIDGSSVVLSAPQVQNPVAVRFAWSQLAQPNLVNRAGLPAGTFRAGRVPKRDWLEMHVPEAKDYLLVYELDLSKLGPDIHWDVDNHLNIHTPFDRIAYCLELEGADGVSAGVYVSMDAFTDSLEKIGIPTLKSGARFQQDVGHLDVISDVDGIVQGANLDGGNIEFWPNDYTPINSANVPYASAAIYDFGDEPSMVVDGYGSMQVHNHDAKQTIFALNDWRAGSGADLGIGCAPTGSPDWTFAANAAHYKTKRLRVFVRCK